MRFDEIYDSVSIIMYNEVVEAFGLVDKDVDSTRLANLLKMNEDGSLAEYLADHQKYKEAYNTNVSNLEQYFQSLVAAEDDDAVEIKNTLQPLMEEKKKLETEMKFLTDTVNNLVVQMADITDEAELKHLSEQKALIDENVRSKDDELRLLSEKLAPVQQEMSKYCLSKLENEKSDLDQCDAAIDAFNTHKENILSSKLNQLQTQRSFIQLCKLHQAYKEEFTGFQRAFSFTSLSKAHPYKDKLDKLDNLFLKCTGIRKKDLKAYFSSGMKKGTLFDKLNGVDPANNVAKEEKAEVVVDEKVEEIVKKEEVEVEEYYKQYEGLNDDELHDANTSVWLDNVFEEEDKAELEEAQDEEVPSV